MDIVEALMWRYATKKMTGAIVPDEKLEKIIASAHLAPSGIGLQPYEILIVSNKEWKEKIFPIAMNQAPVLQASHLFVFAAWDNYTSERIDHVFDYLNEERQEISVISNNQRNFAKRYFASFTPEENFHHAAKQAHIALGLAIAAAALEQVDATPMEGFNALALDELLGLKEKGLRSSMLLALGYRDKDKDWNLPLKKVRKPLTELITELK
jgi:nitroreductase